MKRILTAVAATVALLVLTAAPAGAHYQPLPGEGLVALTKRICGSSATWQEQAARNGLSGNYWLYIGRTYDIKCVSTAAAPSQPRPPAVAAPSAAATWVHPLGSGCIVPNGSREFGTNRGNHRHGGIDMGAPAGAYMGDPIYAVHSGTAHHGDQPSGAGTYVWVDHHDGTSSWYFHMNSRAVGNNVGVSAGQTIGYVGISGNATSVHLHLEIKVNGARVDPVPFLRDRGVRVGC